jgi:3-oxoacyl-[acyl-carrier protein] reductase
MLSQALAAVGASVGVNYASSKDAANQLVTDIKSEGRKAVAVKATIANNVDIENLFAETEKIFGRLDILVNDAGIYEFVPLTRILRSIFTDTLI